MNYKLGAISFHPSDFQNLQYWSENGGVCSKVECYFEEPDTLVTSKHDLGLIMLYIWI